MTKEEALPIVKRLDQELTGTEYEGQKILGFVIAPLDANRLVIKTIAKRYLKNRDHQDYYSLVNHPLMYVEIHVILEPKEEHVNNEEPYDIKEWPYQLL